MSFGQHFRTLLAFGLAACLACAPAHGLVSLNEGRDRIHVTGSFGVSHDSNVFAANGSEGDFIYTSSIVADYQRRAGWIGVNASVAMNIGLFSELEGQDFRDPTFGLELTKQTGRTTGSLTFSLARESRADAAVNTRSSSWNYATGLNFRYHIVGNWDLAGALGYAQREYVDDAVFSNLSTYSGSADLFHVFSSERDMIFGYRYRYSETSRDAATTDHAVTLGLHGKLIRGINGTLRVGYQTRVPHGGIAGNQAFHSWTASGSVSYAINKKLNLSGQISKDFSTTAVDSSVDMLTASLEAQYAFNSRWSLSSSLAFGDSRFLGESGRVVLSLGPPAVLGPNRHDNFVSWSATTGYSLNEHFKIGLTYLWFRNWSTISFADFVRNSWNLNVSSRW